MGFVREIWPLPGVVAMFLGIGDSYVGGLEWLMLPTGTIGANVVSLVGAQLLRYLTSLAVEEAGPWCIYPGRFSSIVASTP